MAPILPTAPRTRDSPQADSTCGRFVNLVNEVPIVAADPTVLANRLRPVLLKLSRQLRREIHSLGVTGGQVSLLVQIKQRPGIGMRELAALERISVPGMSKYVSKLEEAGLVQRASVEGDQRRVGLRLTEAGHKVLRSVKSKRTAWLSARLRELDPDELDAIDAAIEPLMNLLEAEEA
jgi:DNA-binding MarR family transcriptional regulator